MIIVINHKTNLTLKEIKIYEKKLRKYNVIILPTICYMSLFNKGKYILGSQDISEFNEKNKTGEITGEQLNSLNSKYCLIGHSDRRIFNKESNETILIKLENCFKNNIIPIYCFGEITDNDNELFLKEEVDLILYSYKNKQIIFAYEPVQNIGSNDPNLLDIENKLLTIKKYVHDKYNVEMKIIYGGGVNNSNIEFIKNIKSIEGIIISSESLNIKTFDRLYKKINE